MLDGEEVVHPIGSSIVQPTFIDKHTNLFIKQTRKGCYQEMLGCEAQTEFKIATMEDKNTNIYYALENTSCLNRFCLGRIRPFTMNVSEGEAPGGTMLARFERPMRCPMGACKCCCFQEINGFDRFNRPIGTVKEKFFCCVPVLGLYTPDGNHVYDISMPTCMGGACVDICAEGCCNCRVPFYYFAPNGSRAKENKLVPGYLTKIWTNLTTELLSDATTFESVFPTTADGDMKMNMLGAAFLINQLFFETEGTKGGSTL